jgi:hypothetical protein
MTIFLHSIFVIIYVNIFVLCYYFFSFCVTISSPTVALYTLLQSCLLSLTGQYLADSCLSYTLTASWQDHYSYTVCIVYYVCQHQGLLHTYLETPWGAFKYSVTTICGFDFVYYLI